MRKILVPYDGSKPSLKALEYVVERTRRGEKLLVEVLFALPLVIPVEFVSWDVVEQWQASEIKRVLGDARFEKLKNELNARVHTAIGDPVEKIVAYAKKRHCREIVMGTRGMGRIKGLVMGSVATKVVQLTPLPVTLVK